MTAKLKQIMRAIGLTYQDVQRRSADVGGVNAKTVSEIANGRKPGSDRSRARILHVLNHHPGRQKEYTFEDVFGEAEEEDRRPIVVRGTPLSEVIMQDRR